MDYIIKLNKNGDKIKEKGCRWEVGYAEA